MRKNGSLYIGGLETRQQLQSWSLFSLFTGVLITQFASLWPLQATDAITSWSNAMDADHPVKSPGVRICRKGIGQQKSNNAKCQYTTSLGKGV